MKYILYCTQNNINKKIYIGIHKTFTPGTFDGYLGCGVYTNGTGLRNSTPFQKAVKKYGSENFSRTVLAILDNEYDAYELEAKIVDSEFLKRMDTYNVAVGGRAKSFFNPVSQYDLFGNLIETFDSIDTAAKQVGVLGTYIFKCCCAINYTCYGYYWRFVDGSINTSITTTTATELQRGSRKIIQYSLAGYKIKTWDSAKEAAFKLHCDRSTITAACRGKKKTLKDYQWRYYSDGIESLPPIQTVGGKSRPIIQLDTEGRFLASFNSIHEAILTVELSNVSLNKALKTGKLVGGFYWKYV